MSRTPFLLAALALGGPFLAAQSPAKPAAKPKAPYLEEFRFGVHLGLISGTTDSVKYLTDKKQGFVLGLEGTWDVVAPGQRLRARLDVITFPSVTVRSINGSGRLEDNTIKATSLGLDYLYFFSHRPEGWYWTGGGNINNWKQDNNSGDSKDHNALGVATGFGYQFNRTFGLEARGTWTRWQTNFRPGSIHNAGTASLEGSFRF